MRDLDLNGHNWVHFDMCKENVKEKHEFLKEREQEMVERMISVFDEEEIQMRMIKSARREGKEECLVEMAKK